MIDLTEVRDFYNEHFYSENDAAHNLEHVDAVYAESLALRERLDMDIPDDSLIMAVYTHDIFSTLNRARHHVLAHDYVLSRSNKYFRMFSDDELRDIAIAVFYHRASVTPTNELTSLQRVVRLADRGKPDINRIAKRSLSYTIAKGSSNPIEVSMKHIKDKYGRGGYAASDLDYQATYGPELLEMWEIMDTLDVAQMELLCQ